MIQDWKIGYGKPTGIWCWLQGDENMKFLPFKKELKMNDKIKELAERAGFVLWGDEFWSPGDAIDWSSRYDDELTKFVELIVKECTDIADKAGPYKSNDLIKKHFGIE